MGWAGGGAGGGAGWVGGRGGGSRGVTSTQFVKSNSSQNYSSKSKSTDSKKLLK